MSDGESQQSLPRPFPEDSRSRARRGFQTDLTVQFDLPIIAKVLANRLREVLAGLISPFQSTFILKRQMIDSIVLAKEMVAAWRRSSTACFM